MQIFMRNIPFAVNDEDLKIALAQRLHKPPFPTDPPINFLVDIFRPRRGARHRVGIITLPSAQIGDLFLSLFASGIHVKQGVVMFSRSTRPVNAGLVETVRTTPWTDPQTLRQQKAERAALSTVIPLAGFSFGRFCRDGTFSAEASYRGTVSCDVESKQVQIQLDTKPNRSVNNPPNTSSFGFLSEMFGALDFSELFKGRFSVLYSARRIIAIAAPTQSSTSQNRVFLHSDLPPTFYRHKDAILDALDDRPDPPERTSCFGDGDERVTSRASQGLCLTFETRGKLETFLERCKALHLPRPLIRDIPFAEREIYSEINLATLESLVLSLDFGLAFEVEKAVWAGLLEPLEVLGLRQTILDLQERYPELDHAAIFRYFVATLRVPGLDSLPSPRRRRRTKKPQANGSPVLSLAGKFAEASEAYIDELKRPKNRYSPPAGICQSYHLILTPSTQILEGPLPDQSNSVLRRFANQECFLRVSFQDEAHSYPRRDPTFSINELLEKRYKRPLISGLQVAGRSYSFLGYSMSGLKDYSVIFVRKFQYQGVTMRAQDIRNQLGDFSKIQYRPALLGARWSQAFSASDPSVTLETDQIQFAYDKASTTDSVFTDGCSSISVALSRKVWRSLRRSTKMPRELVPSAFQFRCGGAKGILVQDPSLKGETLIFRPSQTKFEAADLRTLDITATSARPIPVYLNRPLIALLEHHGTPANTFMELQQAEIREVQSIKDSLQRASKIFSQHGLGASFRLPSLFNNLFHQLHLEIGPWSDPGFFRHRLIKTALACATTHILREIKHRGRIFVPGSYTLIGVSDEWDCLEEGEIYATVFDDRTGLNLEVEGRVLITRSPQIHPGDAQFVTAVRRPELNHLTNVVVFACKGSRSMPSQLGGGDLDGDIYNLILDEKLFPPKGFTADPGEYKGLEPKTTELPCTISDVASFVIDYFKADLIGYISILHLRISDLQGLGCEACIQLAEHASHAVDFVKTGVPVDFQKLPPPPDRTKPDFLSGEGVNPQLADLYYQSIKILGQLYRSVPVYDHPDLSEIQQQQTDSDKIEMSLSHLGLRTLGLPALVYPDEDLLEEMRNILDEYSDQLMAIAKTHTISKHANVYLSEAELVSGTIQERYTDHRKRKEAVAAMNLQTRELARAIRFEFQSPQYRDVQHADVNDEEDQEEYEDWDEDWDDLAGDEVRRRDKFERAWAAWIVAEEALEDDPLWYGPFSFGLIALGTILEVVKEARNAV